MAGFKTPKSNKFRSRGEENAELQTPLKIPASPFLETIGYGCGVHIFQLERSPKVGFMRSPWAIKKVNRLVGNDKKYNERIKLEAEILRKLDHPNIVGFRGFTESRDGAPCLAMEKLDISLGDMIEESLDFGKGPFPADNILKIAFELAKGLEYLHHTVRILHGDMKSFNVLVSQDCKIVKICDFGVSVPLNAALEMDTTNGDYAYIGTNCWSPPEVIQEVGPVTNKADMWAYGLVLWEMIALSPPHLDSDQSMDGSYLDDSMTGNVLDKSKENCNPNNDMNDSVVCLGEKTYSKFGTRPPLPAIDLGPEYQKVLELFYTCTDLDYKTRPSAKGVVMFFNKYVFNK